MIDYIIAQIKEKASNIEKENIRYGQAVFIETYKLFPKEADILTGSACDCFYRDELVDAFLERLKSLATSNVEELPKKPFNNRIAKKQIEYSQFMYLLGETAESLKLRGGKV